MLFVLVLQGSACGQSAANNREEHAPVKISPTELMDHIVSCVSPILPGALDAVGSLRFLVTVDREGVVQEAKPLTSGTLLVPYGEKALRQWRFSPMTAGAETIPMQGVVVVSMGWDRYEPNPRCPAIPVVLNSGEIESLIDEQQQISHPRSTIGTTLKGNVQVQVTVDRDGRVIDAGALSGELSTCEAILTSVRGWKFRRYYQNERPVRFTGTIDVSFDFNVKP